ncbi:hypothetical protein H8356DRAFT_1346418 [Neocallimastix lanati (nom. inval.)]|nr:hypothetical protein H8356DRAFT_1346418 [Neocallimastix sp. JGI-2020a]
MLAIHNNLSKIIKWLIEYNIKKINGDSLLNKNKAINRNNSEIVELSIDYCSLILYIKFAIAVNEFFLNEDSVISNVFILPLNINLVVLSSYEESFDDDSLQFNNFNWLINVKYHNINDSAESTKLSHKPLKNLTLALSVVILVSLKLSNNNSNKILIRIALVKDYARPTIYGTEDPRTLFSNSSVS